MATLSVPQALQLLQLEPGATRKQIRAAYKRLALQLHPDKAISNNKQQQQQSASTAAFALLSAAYSLLVQGQSSHAAAASSRSHQYEGALPPFETAYATGSLFNDPLLDEAVLMGLPLADVVAL